MADGLEPLDSASPTGDERLLAMLAHILSISGGGFIAPLVLLFAKRESRFVRFHALQALLMSAAFIGVMFGGFVLVAFLAAVTMKHGGGPEPGSHGPPPLLFLFFPLVFLGMGGWIVVSIVLGVRANAGHWSALPGFGWLTRKLLGFARP